MAATKLEQLCSSFEGTTKKVTIQWSVSKVLQSYFTCINLSSTTSQENLSVYNISIIFEQIFLHIISTYC